MGVACGPGYALIRAQALGAGPVSAPIPNAGLTRNPAPFIRWLKPTAMNYFLTLFPRSEERVDQRSVVGVS